MCKHAATDHITRQRTAAWVMQQSLTNNVDGGRLRLARGWTAAVVVEAALSYFCFRHCPGHGCCFSLLLCPSPFDSESKHARLHKHIR
eukprot:m.302966 g.302966  ORF g.302966 m.302966 type:complete len:88 (-) comp15565_c0_seq1:120-383(-)